MRAYVRTCPNIYFPSVLISLVVAVVAAVREYNNNMIMIIITRTAYSVYVDQTETFSINTGVTSCPVIAPVLVTLFIVRLPLFLQKTLSN